MSMIPPRREKVPGSLTSVTGSYPRSKSQVAVSCHARRSPARRVRPRRAISSGWMLFWSSPPSRARATAVALAIELLHRPGDPVAQRDLDGLGRAGHLRVRDGPLVGVERLEHVLRELSDLPARVRRRDADTHPREALAH